MSIGERQGNLVRSVPIEISVKNRSDDFSFLRNNLGLAITNAACRPLLALSRAYRSRATVAPAVFRNAANKGKRRGLRGLCLSFETLEDGHERKRPARKVPLCNLYTRDEPDLSTITQIVPSLTRQRFNSSRVQKATLDLSRI